MSRLFSRGIVSGSSLFLAFYFSGCSRPVAPVENAEGARVASLAPSLTEIVCALGAGERLVGRTSACNYPPQVINVPVIGGFGAPSLDALLNVRPTLVLEADLEDETVGRMIDRTGLKRARIKCSHLDDIPQAVLTVGDLLHYEDAALALSENLKMQIARLRVEAQKRANPPLVFVEIWHDPLMTVGKQSFVSELIALAGGRNLGDEVAGKDYFNVSTEWVIARNPDVIICLYMTKAAAVRDNVAARTGWAQIKAVRQGRVYGGLDNNLILRPGPRVLQGIDILRKCIAENKDKATGRQEDQGTGRQGEWETRGTGDKGNGR